MEISIRSSCNLWIARVGSSTGPTRKRISTMRRRQYACKGPAYTRAWYSGRYSAWRRIIELSGYLGYHRHMEETLYLFPRRALSQMRDESFFTVVANCKQLYCPEEIRIFSTDSVIYNCNGCTTT